MKALTWHGKNDIRCDTVPDPKDPGRPRCHHQGYGVRDLRLGPSFVRRRDAVDGKGRCAGPGNHGEVVNVGPEYEKLKVGDRVVVPFTISCGECFFCRKGFFSGCERSNPNHKMAEKLWLS